jgi:hypothetical protein
MIIYRKVFVIIGIKPCIGIGTSETTAINVKHSRETHEFSDSGLI